MIISNTTFVQSLMVFLNNGGEWKFVCFSPVRALLQ